MAGILNQREPKQKDITVLSSPWMTGILNMPDEAWPTPEVLLSPWMAGILNRRSSRANQHLVLPSP